MVPSFTILILAWTIGGICSVNYLNTGGFIGNMVNNSAFPIYFTCDHLCGGRFSRLCHRYKLGNHGIARPHRSGHMHPCSHSTSDLSVPVILAGAVYGDHISPISDTTILSSTGAGCNHIDHVSTQMIYAGVVAISCVIGYTLLGITNSILLAFSVSLVVMLLIILILNKRAARNNPIDYTNIS